MAKKSIENHHLSPDQAADLLSFERGPSRHARVFAALLTTALVGGSILPADIAINKAELAGSKPVIHSIAEAMEKTNNNTATIFIEGFAGYDGSWIAKKMTYAIQASNDCRIMALEYSKEGVGIPDIAHSIAEKAEGLSSVSLYGYSIGGLIAIEVAKILIEKYNIGVDFIYLDHTPSAADSIRPKLRDQGEQVIDIVSDFKDFGMDIEYSYIARKAVEAVVPTDMSYLSDTTTPLMISQFTVGITADPQKSLSELSSETHAMPVIVYITSKDPDTDYMVYLMKSIREFSAYAKQANLRFIVASVDGAIHSRLDLTVPQYTDTLSSIAPALAHERSEVDKEFRFLSGVDIHTYIMSR